MYSTISADQIANARSIKTPLIIAAKIKNVGNPIQNNFFILSNDFVILTHRFRIETHLCHSERSPVPPGTERSEESRQIEIKLRSFGSSLEDDKTVP